jgi:hypothetical protein
MKKDSFDEAYLDPANNRGKLEEILLKYILS